MNRDQPPTNSPSPADDIATPPLANRRAEYHPVLTDERPVDPEDESLVAYLDGELEPDERSRLEQRLLDEPSLRGRLQQLQRSWDWLEELPSSTPNERLVESTLELVVSDVIRARGGQRSWPDRLRTPLLVLLLIGLPPLLAVASVRLWRLADYRRQLNDLAIAENIEAYLEADDLNFVRELAAHPRWNQMILAAREVGLIPLDASPLVADAPVAERAERLEELGNGQRASLAVRWDRFTRLPPETKTQVRRTHRVVAQQTDAAKLVRAMKDYAAWKETLRPQITDDIEGRSAATTGDPRRRRDALDRAIDETVRELTSQSGLRLDDETTEAIYRVLEQIVMFRLDDEDEGTSALVEFLRGRFENVGQVTDQDPEEIAIRWAIASILRSDGGPPSMRFGPPPSQPLPPLSPLTVQELEWIAIVLPPAEQQRLSLYAGDYHEFRRMYLRAWAEEAIERTSPWPRRRGDGWEQERYLALPEAARDRIDLDDPENLSRHLSRGPRRPPPRGPGPPGDRGER